MRKVKGFTLLELIFTVAILATVLSLGVPTLTQWIQRSKTTDLQYTLLHSIHYTRTQATQLQSIVTLCPGTNDCVQTWGDTLLIFNDLNGNGTRDADETLLKQIDIGYLGNKLDWRSFRRKTYVQFNAKGITTALNGTFHYCSDEFEEDFKFAIVLSRTGRVRVTDTPNCD